MEEEKKIMEKRSSFRGWKERNKGKINQRRNIVVIVIIISTLFAIVAYPYWSKIGDDPSPVGKQNKTSNSTLAKNKTNSSNVSKNTSSTVVNTPKVTSAPKETIVGKMNVPIVSNGLEITVKNVNPTNFNTNIWISVRNVEDNEKQFKIGPGTVVTDNMGQQYENIKVPRSHEITQTNLSANAMKEGAVFFERLKEGRILKKLILNVNNEKIEFILNSSNI